MARIRKEHRKKKDDSQRTHSTRSEGVSGFDANKWSEAEKNYFLFGMVAFNKDFVGVRRFIGTKNMGEILCQYYGKFHPSPEYNKLSDYRKMNSHNGSFGWRIFSGCRQKLLLSRILPRVSKESRKTLLKFFKASGDSKKIPSLIDYVLSLKAIVGRDILVEAVGLGNEGQDLARMAFEPWRWSEVTGEAYSSLSTEKIIQTINARSSKARSSELFWEAVWPRLVARGWRSEVRRRKYGSEYLVFIVPGISKVSKKKLKDGEQFFKSVITLLDRVAKEPELIEVDGSGDDVADTCPELITSPTTSVEPEVVLIEEDETPRGTAMFDLKEEDKAPKKAENSNSERRYSTRTRPPTSTLIAQAAYGYEKPKRRKTKPDNADA